MRTSFLASSLLLLGCLACGDDDGPTTVTALALEEVTAGLDFPLFLTAPAGDERLFVVERGGLIRILRDGEVLATPFLDVSALVSNVGEQGLLCLAFAPQYASSGTFFVSYTDADGDLIVASYRVSSDPDVAEAASAVVRLSVPHPEPTHYGGMLAFGPDGYLYVGSGDGGAPGEFSTTGQDRSDLLGSILRLDVSGDAGYAVPSGNPFVGTAGARPEIWSYGVRNPWRFSFDRATGDLYIGDVGEDQREELNVASAAEGGAKGLNFGWAVAEGLACAQGGTCDRTGFTDPVLDYTHDNGCSITGGYVYRGAALAGLQGTYFFGDFCGGWVQSVRMSNGQVTEDTSWPALDTGGSITSFGEDAAGELYVLTSDGRVSRIVAATSAARASRTSRSAP
jgi:glucose/arabinose dehydrogenase